jgi:hypothetical protein
MIKCDQSTSIQIVNEWTKKDKHNKKQRAREIKCELQREIMGEEENVEEEEKQAPHHLCLIY